MKKLPMTPKEKIISFCWMKPVAQWALKKQLLEALEEFLQTCTKEDLAILNHREPEGGEIYTGLWLPAEALAMLGAYGSRFYNT